MSQSRVLVVGAGVAGLTVAYHVATARPDLPIVVVEATGRVGGQIATTTTGGYTVEHGATSLLAHRPETAHLLDRLGLRSRLHSAGAAGRHNFLYIGGALRPVPRSLREAAASPLLSWRGKLRLAAEPLVGRPCTTDCETISEFAARRFGDEFARVIARTALQGITAGDADQTSLRALAPQLAELDRAAGRSGLLAQALRARRRARGRLDGSSGPATFIDGGLRVLPETLARALQGRLRLAAPVRELKQGRLLRYAAELESGDRMEADQVVLAVPAFQAARLLRQLAPAAARLLDTIPYAGLRMVALGYPRSGFPKAQAPEGLGFLVPPDAALGIIGAIVNSNLFPEQAPPDRVLVRVFAGGVFAPTAADLAHEDALELVASALRSVYGVRAHPELVQDVRWRHGIPQYTRDHPMRLERLHRALARHPGIHLTGNAYRGVGIDDTIREATRLSAAVLGAVSSTPATAGHGIGRRPAAEHGDP
jgi:protoporphyrinogen/coproporphyrinogen III oxidase